MTAGGYPPPYDHGTAVLDTTPDMGAAAPRRRRTISNGGSDLGLLIIRLALGGTFVAHGLQVVYSLYGGPGVAGLAEGLAGYGYVRSTTLALVVGLTELIGGGLIIVGLFTPLAAAALLGIVINAVLVKYSLGYFVQPNNPAGIELDVLLGAMATGLLFAGPGRVSLDVALPWFRRPMLSGWIGLLLAAAAALLVYFLLHR